MLHGPKVELPSHLAVPIGMALHELTTNAAKYGSLSVLGGSVRVTWDFLSERQLRFNWIEQDGPPVEAPTHRGFGSRLLERVLTTQVRADVQMAYEPNGVQVEVIMPLSPAPEPI